MIAARDPLIILQEILGAWMHGRVPVVVSPDTPESVLARLQAFLASAEGGWARHAKREPSIERREGLIATTSGTTGIPKLVVLPHECLHRTALALAVWYAQPSETQALVSNNLFRSDGIIRSLAALASGWTLHMYPPGMAGSVLLGDIRTRGIHLLGGTVSVYRFLLRYWSGTPLPSVRHVQIGGEPASSSLIETVRTAFPNADLHLTYGMTECGLRVAGCRASDPRSRAGGIGVPFPHFHVKIAPVAEVPAPIGELHLKGPTVFLGYLQEDGSYSGLDADGFHHSGDLMRLDPDGWLYPQGRLDAVIKVGGLLVNLREVETMLRALPGVADAVCGAEPHDLLGRVVVARVVAAPGATLEEGALTQECRSRMERHKVPKSIHIVERLAETAGGKTTFEPSAP